MAERDELLSHEYDGIQEYDNDLPRWWVWLFVATVLWGVWRIGYYHFGPGLLQDERLARSMAEHEQVRKAAAVQGGAVIDNQALLSLVSDKNAMSAGESIWNSNCVACHLQGQGLVGPNLTDDYWVHGGEPKDIYQVISDGVPEKGMISWKEKLSPQQISQVTMYVWTLHGKELPNPKKPEGEKVARLPL
jgi:cytochrome c oxidase cbb3-type subunit 3